MKKYFFLTLLLFVCTSIKIHEPRNNLNLKIGSILSDVKILYSEGKIHDKELEELIKIINN